MSAAWLYKTMSWVSEHAFQRAAQTSKACMGQCPFPGITPCESHCWNCGFWSFEEPVGHSKQRPCQVQQTLSEFGAKWSVICSHLEKTMTNTWSWIWQDELLWFGEVGGGKCLLTSPKSHRSTPRQLAEQLDAAGEMELWWCKKNWPFSNPLQVFHRSVKKLFK